MHTHTGLSKSVCAIVHGSLANFISCRSSNTPLLFAVHGYLGGIDQQLRKISKLGVFLP